MKVAITVIIGLLLLLQPFLANDNDVGVVVAAILAAMLRMPSTHLLMRHILLSLVENL